MNQTTKSMIVVVVILAAMLAAAWYLSKGSPGGPRPRSTYSEKDGQLPNSGQPQPEKLQRCDGLVINAWKRLSILESEFISRFEAATPEQKSEMRSEQTALLFSYEPYENPDVPIPANDEKDTPAERARKEIWRVGRQFETSIKQNPGNANNYASYAVFLKPRNEVLAVKNFKEAISLWPENYVFHFLLADYLYRSVTSNRYTVFKGEHPVLRRLKNEKEILHELDLAIKYDPNNPFLLIYRGQVLISLGKDAVEIMNEFERALDTPGNSFYIIPPPRPAKMQYWYDSESLVARITELNYAFEGNYGFYLDGVIERYISDGGLREAAERKGPKVFSDMYRIIEKMAKTMPMDKSYFYLTELVGREMVKYYEDHGGGEPAELARKTLDASFKVESEIRKFCKTNKAWAERLPEGVEPTDPKSVSLKFIETKLRRNNPSMRDILKKYHPRFIRESLELAEKFPVEADPSKKGAYWKPKLPKPAQTDPDPDQPFAEEVPKTPSEAPPGGDDGGE
ncbi:MAG: hypothetical protein HRF49_03820 [bacterium]